MKLCNVGYKDLEPDAFVLQLFAALRGIRDPWLCHQVLEHVLALLQKKAGFPQARLRVHLFCALGMSFEEIDTLIEHLFNDFGLSEPCVSVLLSVHGRYHFL